MSVQQDKEKTTRLADKETRPAPVSRRAMIKGGAVSMPAILTLQSGAALARSSNMISASSTGTTDNLGRTLCLDTNSVYPVGNTPGVFDLGSPPQATVNIITDRDYQIEKGGKGVKVTAGEMCESGGTFWWKPSSGAWEQVDLPYNGIVLSTGAVTSIADFITDNLI